MRRATLVVAALAVVLFMGAPSDAAAADVSFGFFYSNLSPYGSWAVSANYGQVWQPYTYAPGWNPYYDGHWVYTDLGWTWVSDYRWGAIPYHYGTWAVDPVLGWIWVPGYVWAPSWVVFCSGGDFIGWAPVPPRYVVGATLGFHDIGREHFVIVPSRRFLAPHVRVHAVPRAAARNVIARARIVNNITVQNNIVVNHGPSPRGIEKVVGARVRPVPIHSVKRVTPGRQFDVDDVRVREHGRGGRTRVTAPEPRSASRGARPSEPTDRSEMARPSGQARKSEVGRPSGPPRQQGPGKESARQPGPPDAGREPARVERSQPTPGKSAGKSSRPPRSQKPTKPEKPPGKPGRH